jgi:penicillin-binding protein 1A
VTIDPANGHILAMASSGDYRTSKFNLAAQGHRQPGSTFKTMVLMTALRRGVDPNRTSYVSHKLDLQTPYGPWQVSTYSNSYSGRMSLFQATLKSDNTVFAQLDLDLGPEEVRQTAYDMGVTTKLDGYPAEGLGGLRLGVSPLEMANAYATIASGGMRNKPIAITKVEFPNGKVDNLDKPHRVREFSDGVTYEATKVLRANVLGGTGTAAGYGCPAAGKTGTTDNFNDAWFVGFTPKLSTAVWVGYPNAQIEMRSVHGISVAGGTFPARIWHDYMTVAHGTDCSDFPLPKDPFVAKPFFAKYAQQGASGISPCTPAPTATGDTTEGTSSCRGTSGEKDKEQTTTEQKPSDTPVVPGGLGPPDAYESPPQRPPSNGNGNPHGNGNGNGNGHGNGTGGTDSGGAVAPG